MGSDKTQMGTRVDEDVYNRFKKYVENKHGRTRGVLSHEVEKALEAYISGEFPDDRLARIENDVATIKANLAEADGGEVAVPEPTPTPSTDDAHTQTHREPSASTGTEYEVDTDDTSKPNEKAPKSAKVEYLFDDMTTDPSLIIHPNALRNRIDGLWGFGERATNDLIDLTYKRFNAKPVREKGGETWYVALGRTDDDREDGIDEWAQGDEFEFVNPTKTSRDDWPV